MSLWSMSLVPRSNLPDGAHRDDQGGPRLEGCESSESLDLQGIHREDSFECTGLV